MPKRSTTTEVSPHVVTPDAKSSRRSIARDTDTSIEDAINEVLRNAGIVQTQTKNDWCLREGLIHICRASKGSLLQLVQHHGPPMFYHKNRANRCRHSSSKTTKSAATKETTTTTCFASLCRIIAGQQLAGAAARTVYERLLNTTKHDLTPNTVLQLAQEDIVVKLQKPAGLSRSKANAIVDLASHFVSNESPLSESFLTENNEEIRTELLKVKGIGPWSCDMFCMFVLEQSNVLPLGDLVVRKQLSRHFQSLSRGSGKENALCPKKDLDRIHVAVAAFAPFHSLLSYYMWKAADVAVDFGKQNEEGNSKVKPPNQTSRKKAKR